MQHIRSWRPQAFGQKRQALLLTTRGVLQSCHLGLAILPKVRLADQRSIGGADQP
jgi:hypothetical protein